MLLPLYHCCHDFTLLLLLLLFILLLFLCLSKHVGVGPELRLQEEAVGQGEGAEEDAGQIPENSSIFPKGLFEAEVVFFDFQDVTGINLEIFRCYLGAHYI